MSHGHTVCRCSPQRGCPACKPAFDPIEECLWAAGTADSGGAAHLAAWAALGWGGWAGAHVEGQGERRALHLAHVRHDVGECHVHACGSRGNAGDSTQSADLEAGETLAALRPTPLCARKQRLQPAAPLWVAAAVRGAPLVATPAEMKAARAASSDGMQRAVENRHISSRPEPAAEKGTYEFMPPGLAIVSMKISTCSARTL